MIHHANLTENQTKNQSSVHETDNSSLLLGRVVAETALSILGGKNCVRGEEEEGWLAQADG